MGKKDINWINAVKALCIIFVFLRHSENYYGVDLGWTDSLFLTFYVNAFFLVSGYLLFWKQLTFPRIDEDRRLYMTGGGGRLLFWNIVYRIIIPSIIFSAIEFFPSCIIQGRGIDAGYALYKTVGGGTYWFTSALVVAELIILLLLTSRKRNIWFYTIICFFLGIIGLVIARTGILDNGIWAWRQGLIALIFLALGGLYWRYEKIVDQLMKWWFVIPLMAVYVLIIALCENTNPLISMLTIQPLGFLTSIIACLLLVWGCKQLPEIRPLSFIGQNSIGFYFMSGALPITISMLAHKLMPSSNVVTMLGIWIVCLVTSYIAVLLINRWLPWLWDLRVIKHKN